MHPAVLACRRRARDRSDRRSCARHRLDKFPPRLPAARNGAARLPQYEAETRLRERLIGLGYHEALTIPHVAEERNDLFRPADVVVAKLANPLSEEANVLRSTGAATMAGVIE